jgi:hypothetical protein
VLYHDDCVSTLDEAIDYEEQLLYVSHMEPRGRLAEYYS